MKTTLLTLIALAITLFSFGQAPEAFKYQAVVRNASGAILTNQAVGFQIAILQGSPAGMTVYTESFSPTTNNYGLVNIEIGTGTTTDNFTTIDWANGPYFIETAVDVAGGTSYVVMGTSQLVSVPYALYAKTSGSSTPGPQGPAGNDGAVGATGPQGPAGNDGAIGATGPQGPQGPAGNDGAVGATGPMGPQGPAGNDGAVGATGPMGPQGPAGNDGAVGATGPMGPQGPAGNDGAVGATGPQGPQGPAGNDGAVGAIGPQGPQGVQGLPGNDGVNGTNGTDGQSAYEIWLGLGNTGSETDFINSLTGPQGPAGNNGAVGATGPQGPQGPAGIANYRAGQVNVPLGFPGTASVVFSSPFPDNNYSISLASMAAYAGTNYQEIFISNKTANGFTVNVEAMTGSSLNISWMAMPFQ